MNDDTAEQIAAAAIAVERVGVRRFAATYGEQITLMVAGGNIGADDATLLVDRIRAFASMITTGLHVGGDGPVTRAAVRAAMAADSGKQS